MFYSRRSGLVHLGPWRAALDTFGIVLIGTVGGRLALYGAFLRRRRLAG
jgi:hypothetical protein